MIIFTKVIGLGAIVFSTLGLLLCLAGIVGVWMVKTRVKAIGNAAFAAADDSLVFVNAKMDRVQQALEKSRQRVGWISRAAEQLKDEKADARKASEPLLQALDEVFQQVQAAETWLDSCQAVASGVSRVSEAVVSSEYAASHEESAGIAIAKRMQELSESVADVLAKLQVVRQKLVELRETGKLAREVAATVVACHGARKSGHVRARCIGHLRGEKFHHLAFSILLLKETQDGETAHDGRNQYDPYTS